ncbi:OmpA family protein [Polaribacter marinivivus]|uniref:OmpA family protein n=1 Tax=Polaribacter marinivivus TaxID=1524260 RepID=A0ABV8R7G8_9FLAO
MKNQNKIKVELMKKICIVSLIFLASFQVNSQNFDKWSVDLGGGIHQIGTPISSGYSENIFGQGNLGVRYMFNERFGLRLDLGYNQFSANEFSQPFTSNFYRASLQGVVNMGNVLKFHTWTKRISLLAHGGIGVGIVNVTDPVVSGNVFTLPLSVGITPQFKISDRIAVFADFSSIINFYQDINFDGGAATSSRESNISLFNTSIGLNISFGRYRKLADFYYEEKTPVESELDKIKKRLTTAEKEIADLKTKETISSPNKDLIMTELDARYIKRDEVKENKYADVVSGGNVNFIKELLNRGYINVYFDVNKSEIQEGSLNSVNYLKQFLMDNPTISADLIGYADETGSANRNKTLSQKRAKKVYDVLVAAGINPSRLSYFGGGEDTSVGKSARQFARKVIFKLR